MKQPIIYIAIVGLAVLTACSFISNAKENKVAKSSESIPQYEVSIESEIEDYEDYQVTIHYPGTPNSQIDQTIIDYVNQKKSTFKQKSYKVLHTKVTNNQLHELHIDFEVLYQDQQFFVVRFKETMDFGEEEAIVSQTIMNFDKSEGKRLNLEHIFKESGDYIDRLIEVATSKLIESHEALTEGNRGQLERVLQSRVKLDQPVAITSHGMTVYLNDQQVPFSIQLNKVTVGYNQFEGLIRDEYSHLFKVKSKSKNNTEEQDSSLFPDNEWNIKEKPTAGKQVALTFSDGPHAKVTPMVLNLLEKQDVKATFFMIGKRVSYLPEIAQEVSKAGHEIGNHTWDHSRFNRLTTEEINEQLTSTQRMIYQVTGTKPRLLRLPFDEHSTALEQGKLEAVTGSIGSDDWQNSNPKQIARGIVSQVEDGSIITLRDLYPSTTEVVRVIVDSLKEQGYEFVTVSELKN